MTETVIKDAYDHKIVIETSGLSTKIVKVTDRVARRSVRFALTPSDLHKINAAFGLTAGAALAQAPKPKLVLEWAVPRKQAEAAQAILKNKMPDLAHALYSGISYANQQPVLKENGITQTWYQICDKLRLGAELGPLTRKIIVDSILNNLGKKY